MSNPSIDDLRDLSDEDVKLLYDIVTAAEASAAAPFRALFAAYEQVLAKRGISKDHDQLYLRFLLRMGEGRKVGQGLFDQFESLLDRLGFQVSFDIDNDNDDDDDNDAKETDNRNLAAGRDPSSSPPGVSLLQTQSFRPARRASFDSALDLSGDSKPLGALPIRPRSTNGSHPQSQHIHKVTKPASKQDNDRAESKGLLNPLNQGLRPSLPAGRTLPTGKPVQEVLNESDDAFSENSETTSDYSASEVADEAPEQKKRSETAVKDCARIPPSPPPEDFKVKKHRLEENAKTLKYHHAAARAVLFFRSWCESARQRRHIHQQMFDNARRHDAHILKHQAFDQWRLELHRKKQQRDTQRFFDILETRAGKAHDLFLLSKAFTHWAQCASEETLRKSAARKLILQTRYFNAWRDITVVNDFKARRLCVSKFLSIWIKRTETVLDQEDEADEFNTTKSVQHAYRQWFWKFCERRTPAWHTSRRKDAIFKKWIQKAREALVRNSWAADFRDLELQRSCVAQWTLRSSVVRQHQHDAAIFRHRSLLAPTIETLRRETLLAPLQSKVSQSADLRLVRAVLCIWHRKTRDVLQAHKINELRIMRNAWTQWNDSLRCNALSNVIDDRLVAQALYKWVLAERSVICERAGTEDLQTAVLSRWHAKMKALSASLGQAKHTISTARDNRITSTTLGEWAALTRAKQQQTAVAEAFRQKRLTTGAWKIWDAKSRRATQLDTWAADARFFVLASRSCKLWRSATVATKRKKRREAFANFRAKTLMTRAKSVLDKWRAGTYAKSQLADRGREIELEHYMAIGTDLFYSWRERFSAIQIHATEASSFWSEHVLLRNFERLVLRFRQIEEYEALSLQFNRGIVDVAAASSLRKLNRKAFQLKRQDESAELLLQRNRKKHHWQMLRYWATVTRQRQHMRQSTIEDAQQEDLQEQSFGLSNDALTRQRRRTPFAGRAPPRNASQTMSQLDTARQSQSLAATPAYLRTPSRRSTAGKARAQAGAATEPQPHPSQAPWPATPAANYITPFMSRLRAKYPTSGLASTRRDLTLRQDAYEGSAVGFDEVPEGAALGIGDLDSKLEDT